MKLSNNQIIPQRYLITIHFDRIFLPSSDDGLLLAIQDFLADLADLARKDGIRLMAKFSIVRGKTGVHAHIISNWMAHTRIRDKRHKRSILRISRHSTMKLMNEHFFRTDSPTKRIVKIETNSHVVERYVLEQKSGEQEIITHGEFKANFIPVYTETKIKFYYSKPCFQESTKTTKTGCINKSIAISYALLIILFLISYLFIGFIA